MESLILPIQLLTPVFVDLNGDGYLDIAALIAVSDANAPRQIAVYLNRGSSEP
jgi:hypothetical protein